mgnify:CR=1 FL=1
MSGRAIGHARLRRQAGPPVPPPSHSPSTPRPADRPPGTRRIRWASWRRAAASGRSRRCRRRCCRPWRASGRAGRCRPAPDRPGRGWRCAATPRDRRRGAPRPASRRTNRSPGRPRATADRLAVRRRATEPAQHDAAQLSGCVVQRLAAHAQGRTPVRVVTISVFSPAMWRRD